MTKYEILVTEYDQTGYFYREHRTKQTVITDTTDSVDAATQKAIARTPLKENDSDWAQKTEVLSAEDIVIALELAEQLDEQDISNGFEIEVDGVVHHVHEDAHTRIYDEAYAQGEVDADRRIKNGKGGEIPVVPTWFDKWWKDVTKGGGNLFHNLERFYDELFSSGTSEMYSYIGSPDNKKKLLNIIVNELEYEVEEEQKYIIKLDDKSYLQRYEIDNKNIVTPFRIVGHLKEVAIKFDNKERAEKVAELVEGEVEEEEE